MRWACLIIGTMVSLFSKGFAIECRGNIDLERLSITPDGIVLMTDKFGAVNLDNLHFDEEGYFSLWEIGYICADCKRELGRYNSVCEDCGSDEVALIRIDQNDGREYLIRLFSKFVEIPLTSEEMKDDLSINTRRDFIPERFNRASQLGTVVLGTIIDAGANVDNKGNKSVDVKVGDTIKDKEGKDRGEYFVEAEASQNDNGKSTWKAGARIKYKY